MFGGGVGMKGNWKNLKEIMAVLEDDNFSWTNNFDLKYIDLRIDTRDNHAVIKDRKGNVIDIETLETGITIKD